MRIDPQSVDISAEIHLRNTFRALRAGADLRQQGRPCPPPPSEELVDWVGPSPIRDGWQHEDRRIRRASRPQREMEATRIMVRQAVA